MAVSVSLGCGSFLFLKHNMMTSLKQEESDEVATHKRHEHREGSEIYFLKGIGIACHGSILSTGIARNYSSLGKAHAYVMSSSRGRKHPSCHKISAQCTH